MKSRLAAWLVGTTPSVVGPCECNGRGVRTPILGSMGGEVGTRFALPPLPNGERLFANLPARAIVLDALAPALGDGIIALIDGECAAVIVVRDGAIIDAMSIVKGSQETGEVALAQLRRWESASVSCTRLTGEAMSLLGPLLHGELVYIDLRLEWTAWSQLLDDLRRRGRTFVVELQTPDERGVTVIRGGEQIATFTDSHPELGGPDVLDRLAASGDGSIRVFADSAAPNRGSSSQASPAGAVATALPVPRPTSALDGVRTAIPQRVDGDANEVLASLFGVPGVAQPFAPTLVVDRSGPAGDDVGSLLPQLKLLAQRRLQRSSAPVEEAVDRAADEKRSIEWLVARVRVMRVRGFVPETFEHLADEMQALALKT